MRGLEKLVRATRATTAFPVNCEGASPFLKRVQASPIRAFAILARRFCEAR
jgi:hypothetical protein